MSENKIIFPGSNFVSNKWKNGFGVDFYYDDGIMRTSYTFQIHQQGPSNFAHGGAIASLIDETMTALAFQVSGAPVLTAYLNTQYKAPTFIGIEHTFVASLQKVEGRKIFALCEVVAADGTLTAVAEALFITLEESLSK